MITPHGVSKPKLVKLAATTGRVTFLDDNDSAINSSFQVITNINTGPWSGLSMHPIEHFIYFSTCLIHLVIPSDLIHVVWHLMFTGLAPAAGHSGYNEIAYKKGGKLSLPHASYFHYLHHKYFECNYGELLFPFDKWFGTFHNGTKESGEKIFRYHKREK